MSRPAREILLVPSAAGAAWFLVVGAFGLLVALVAYELDPVFARRNLRFLYAFIALIVAALVGCVSLAVPGGGHVRLAVHACSALFNTGVTLVSLWYFVAQMRRGESVVALLFAVPGALLVASAVLGALKRDTPAHLCRACGYDLRGVETGVCPECGARRFGHAEREAERRWRRALLRRTTLVVLATLAGAWLMLSGAFFTLASAMPYASPGSLFVWSAVATVTGGAVGVLSLLLPHPGRLWSAARWLSVCVNGAVALGSVVFCGAALLRGDAVTPTLMLITAPAAFLVATALLRVGTHAQTPTRLCRACGYDHHGTDAARCPECGAER